MLAFYLILIWRLIIINTYFYRHSIPADKRVRTIWLQRINNQKLFEIDDITVLRMYKKCVMCILPVYARTPLASYYDMHCLQSVCPVSKIYRNLNILYFINFELSFRIQGTVNKGILLQFSSWTTSIYNPWKSSRLV